MDALIKAINKYPNGTRLIIKWNIGLEIRGEIDTIYETNNNFDMDEEECREYYACAFNVMSILGTKPKNLSVEFGSLIEI